MPMMYGWGQYDMLGGGFMWLLFLILLGVVIYFVAGWPRRSGTETPIEILKKRYASGEIAKEQFEQMKKDLGL
ncbi:MAG: SHOCT domain-containing protein [Syntrophaceae bacterium]